jgi:asparagine synthase (glutamine-hydrolysing)
MCGIVGYYSPDRPVAGLAPLLALKGAVGHRGPDGQGCVAIDSRSGRVRELRGAAPDPGGPFPHDVGLGHTRFAIVDLSDAAHQPFWSGDRQLVLVFNGEIYNHVELREELEKLGQRFRSTSDTEVLIASYAEWGLECFERLNGFWALALYDLRRRRLVLSRDRIGRAPLYTAVVGGALYWASEIKALRACCGADAFPLREQAIHDFVQHGWRDVDHGTFYEGVRTLDNASYAVLSRGVSPSPQRFWRLPERRLAEREIPFPDACRELRRLLDDSLRLRERADVPLAMELSGGMDSSSLVALRAARANGAPVAAYTVQFDEPEADESPYARALVARFPGRIEHHLIRPPQLEFWERAHEFVAHMDEPFHAPNVMTNQSVRRQIRRDGFKVVVAGSAGDELLAGYDEYRLPFLRDLLRRGRLAAAGRELAASPHRLGLLRAAIGPERRPPGPACAGELVEDAARAGRRPPARFDALMLGNFGPWKLNQWLRVSDAFQYAIPVESRVPFMDHRVVELGFRLPATYLIRGGWGKYVLRRALEDLLPASIAWRPRKMGFPFPLREWLRESKERLLRHARGVEPPGLRVERLPAHYDALVASHPSWLWRFASVVLWHRRCNLGLPIEP